MSPPAAPAARPQPPVLSVPCGAGCLGHALMGGAPGWAVRGGRADVRRGHRREQSGMGWADGVGGKGRLIFLYSVLGRERHRLTAHWTVARPLMSIRLRYFNRY